MQPVALETTTMKRGISILQSAFEAEVRLGGLALSTGDLQAAYARFERAHILGQSRTWWHVRSHIAFLRWAIAARDLHEGAGQIKRIVAAAVITWLWIPRGNTGGARVSAVESMPIPADLKALLEEAER